MSGGSRGIGLAIALRAARDGANVALLAKTDQPHPKLEGTIHTAARAIERAGGRALAIVGDVREQSDVEAAVARAIERFGGIDIVVNNASAIDLSDSEALAIKRYDLMQDVNVRGTFMLTRCAIPHLRASAHAHVLMLSPPIDLDGRWLGAHLGYTLSKYGMSMCALGFARELADDSVRVNALWPRTLIATAAVRNLLGGEAAIARSRTPELVADAAHALLTRPRLARSGELLFVEELLARAGVTDLRPYACDPDAEPQLGIFVDA